MLINFSKLVDLCSILTGDEITNGYQASKSSKEKWKKKKWEIPQLFVPRKPSTNCFWIDTISQKLENSDRPFVIAMAILSSTSKLTKYVNRRIL